MRSDTVSTYALQTIVASALACLETAQDAWADHPHSRLSTLLDQAMSVVTA